MSADIDRLLDPYRVQFGHVMPDQLDCSLAAAEKAFSEDGNLMAGLYAAQISLYHHVAIPRKVANWLEYGISLYLHGRRDSIDEGLRLKAKGRASPRRKHKEDGALKVANARPASHGSNDFSGCRPGRAAVT